jgi:hypothetical protein
VKIILLILLVPCVALSGCVTDKLWRANNKEIVKVADIIVKPDKLYISKDSRLICISYTDVDANHSIKYLIEKPADSIYTNYLGSIFKDPPKFNVKSINATAHYHHTIKGDEVNYLLLDVQFDIPDESVTFSDYDDKIKETFQDSITTQGVFDNKLLNIILYKQYVKIQPKAEYFEPLAWTNKEGQVIGSTDLNFVEDRRNLLISINNNHMKSMSPNFDIKKYDSFSFKGNNYYRPIVVADDLNKIATYKYGRYPIQNAQMKTMVVSDQCSNLDTDFVLLADSINIPIKLVFSETKQQYNKYELFYQIIGTPFSVATDIVTSPFQLLFGIWFVFFGHM